MKKYFYNSIYQTLYAESGNLYDTFTSDTLESTITFEAAALDYIQTFSEKDSVKVTIFDDNNKILYSTLKDRSENIQEMKDYNQALNSADNFGLFTGKNLSGEKIMAETRSVYTKSGKYLGAVRYTTSLDETDNTIGLGISILVLLGAIMIIFVTTLGVYFLKSIINSIVKISQTAKDIAGGDFNIKIRKRHNDEIGKLCDAVNYMAEELSLSEKLKNEFVSSISHELRTPLTAVKGWAETIQTADSLDSETLNKGLQIIAHETERLSGIVEELLDFSRLQKEKLPVIADKIDILAELGEAVYIFKKRADAEGKILTYDEPKIVSPILGDKNRLKQVFINIIDNALKYTEKGGSVSVNVKEKDTEVIINITDNGCGIPKEHINKVTEKFYKANSAKKGSGIGLAIVDEIVKAHKGSLEIISEENFGTTINISFPVIKYS
jgi:signal transduction histidine kinase